MPIFYYWLLASVTRTSMMGDNSLISLGFGRFQTRANDKYNELPNIKNGPYSLHSKFELG